MKTHERDMLMCPEEKLETVDNDLAIVTTTCGAHATTKGELDFDLGYADITNSQLGTQRL